MSSQRSGFESTGSAPDLHLRGKEPPDALYDARNSLCPHDQVAGHPLLALAGEHCPEQTARDRKAWLGDSPCRGNLHTLTEVSSGVAGAVAMEPAVNGVNSDSLPWVFVREPATRVQAQ